MIRNAVPGAPGHEAGCQRYGSEVLRSVIVVTPCRPGGAPIDRDLLFARAMAEGHHTQ